MLRRQQLAFKAADGEEEGAEGEGTKRKGKGKGRGKGRGQGKGKGKGKDSKTKTSESTPKKKSSPKLKRSPKAKASPKKASSKKKSKKPEKTDEEKTESPVPPKKVKKGDGKGEKGGDGEGMVQRKSPLHAVLDPLPAKPPRSGTPFAVLSMKRSAHRLVQVQSMRTEIIWGRK